MMSDYRERCLEEKGRKCAICGYERRILAHHIDGDRDNNALTNLVPLCSTCHNRIHTAAQGFEQWTENLPESAIMHNSLPRPELEESGGLGEGSVNIRFKSADVDIEESFEVSSFSIKNENGRVNLAMRIDNTPDF